MKNVYCIFILLFAFCFISFQAVNAQEMNISGTWILDRDKSELPERQGQGQGRLGGAFENLSITQDGENLKIETKVQIRDRNVSNMLEMKIGDDAVTKENRRGKTTAKAMWGEDKKSIIVKTEREMQGRNRNFSMKTTETYSLSSDGNVLTVVREMETPRGTRTMTLVFNKK